MERYILVPDSFKGTLSSREICEILREEILRVRRSAEVIAVPVADGGEGSVDAFLAAMGGARIEVPVHGPHMEELTGFYGLLPDGTAVIEMAAAAGLPLVGDRLEPDTATAYGVGELMAAAAENGAQRIILGLGGSAANDGGCGAAAWPSGPNNTACRYLQGIGSDLLVIISQSCTKRICPALEACCRRTSWAPHGG